MTAQYTPGPLEARRNRGPGNNGMTRIFTPNGDIVAEVHAKADAVLFAAAPELAEALREARQALADMVEHWGHSSHYTDEARAESLDRAEHIAAGVIPAALEKAGVAV